MRWNALFLAVILSSLLSCATTTPQPVMTVELFDSRALLPPAPPDAGLVWASPTVSAPVGEMSLPPAAAAEEPLKPETRSAMKLPQEPGAAATFDAALAAPIRPRARPSFPLAAPLAPAPSVSGATAAAAQPPRGAAAPSAAAAARQAPQRMTAPASSSAAPAKAPVPQRQAAGGASAAAAAPSAASANGGTAGSGAAAGTPGSAAATGGSQSGSPASPTASSGDSYGRLREIFARLGDEVQVGLDGAGFLFLGFPDRSPQADGMAFKGKENRNSKTWFTFKALKLGIYDLDFLQQQNATGKSAKETVRVHVVSDAEFTAAVSQKPDENQPASTGTEVGDPAFAEKLTSLGQYEAAVGELLKGYTEGNPGLNDQIAALYMRMHSYDAAGKYYVKNLSPQGAFTARAVIGLVQVAVAQKDQQLLMTYLKPFLAIRDPQAEEPLINAVRMERDKSEIGVGLDLAEEYAARFPSGAWIDEAQFLLAQFLEADSSFRDIARSRGTYSELLKTHPESSFANPARERLLYIDRHFYQVR